MLPGNRCWAKGEEAPTGASIGISGYMIDENTSKSYNMPVGFYISDIVEGSGADKSELDIGNIVTKIDDIDLHVGICGEHGGDPTSVEFCHKLGLDYVSCSPFRVPIARLAAAQAAIKG